MEKHKYVAEFLKREKTNQRCSYFSTFMLIVLLLASLGFWIFAEYDDMFPFAFLFSLFVIALKVARVWYMKRNFSSVEDLKDVVYAYRDNRFNVI